MLYDLDEADIETIVKSLGEGPLKQKLEQIADPDAKAFAEFAFRKYDSDYISVSDVNEVTVHGAYVLAKIWVFNHQVGKYIDPIRLALHPDTVAKINALVEFKIDKFLYQGADEANGRAGDCEWSFEYDEDGWSFELVSKPLDVGLDSFATTHWSYEETWNVKLADGETLSDETATACILKGYELLRVEDATTSVYF